MERHWFQHLGRGVLGLFELTDPLRPCNRTFEIARISAVGFWDDEDTYLMMPVPSPEFKNQLHDGAVSTIPAQYLDKRFVSAQPSPATANDTIIHTRDVMCDRFQDDSWVSIPMGELLDKQSKSPSSSSSP